MADATGRDPALVPDERTGLLTGTLAHDGLRHRLVSSVKNAADIARSKMSPVMSKAEKARPDEREAVVRRLPDGSFLSKSDVVQNLLRYTAAGSPGCFDQVESGIERRLGMRTGDQIKEQHNELAELFTIETPHPRDDGKPAAINILIGVMDRVSEEGPSALGSNDRARELLLDIGKQLVFTGDPELAGPIREALDRDVNTMIELGAVLVHELERHRVFGLDTLAFCGGSVGAVPFIDKVIQAPLCDRWEYKLEQLIKQSQDQRIVTGAKWLLAVEKSTRSFLPEAADSVGVAKLSAKSENPKTESIIPGKKDFLKGLKGGAIATGGTFFKNLLDQFPTGIVPLDIGLKLLCYQIGTHACGSVVSTELNATRTDMEAVWVESIALGRQAPMRADPEEKKPGERGVKDKVNRMMAANPATETKQKQLGWTSGAGLLPAANEYVLKLDPGTRETAERTIENPVESYAYNGSVIGDLWVGLPFDLVMTDSRKSERLIAQVLQRKAEGFELEHEAQRLLGEAQDLQARDLQLEALHLEREAQRLQLEAKGKRLTEADYNRTMHPPLELIAPAGRGIEGLLNGVGSAVTWPFRKISLAKPSPEQRIDYEAAVAPPSRTPAPGDMV